ncbi:MAG TPA: hypothetical protein VK525_11310 [Candidatus Saccharimonadales bacterium]|nr:hypothetical protein [Candidatus Saccharimonadales bacterium]
MFHKIALASVISGVALLCVSPVPGRAQQMPPAKSNPAFEQIKSLAGKWQGASPDGKSVDVEYQVVSNGTAVMERLHPHDEVEMITMYSADGSRVSVTHYCSVGNQPQMQTEPLTAPSPKLAFHFVRATNLATRETGHMHQLTLGLPDGNHLTQEWIFVENGKPTHTEVFSFTRRS